MLSPEDTYFVSVNPLTLWGDDYTPPDVLFYTPPALYHSSSLYISDHGHHNHSFSLAKHITLLWVHYALMYQEWHFGVVLWPKLTGTTSYIFFLADSLMRPHIFPNETKPQCAVITLEITVFLHSLGISLFPSVQMDSVYSYLNGICYSHRSHQQCVECVEGSSWR